jgi:hypothetical protein
MDITYSFVDESGDYVGHANRDGSTIAVTYFRAYTAPVVLVTDVQPAIDALVAAITKRFPHWERGAYVPRLRSDDRKGNPVRVELEFLSKDGAS